MLVLHQILKFENSLSVHVNAVALGVAQCLKNTILLAYVYPYATTCGAYIMLLAYVYPSATTCGAYIMLLAYVYPSATTCGAYTFYWPMFTPLQLENSEIEKLPLDSSYVF